MINAMCKPASSEPSCSEKERARGDHETWMLDENNNIGHIGKDGAFIPKHRYDTVFGKQVRLLHVKEG